MLPLLTKLAGSGVVPQPTSEQAAKLRALEAAYKEEVEINQSLRKAINADSVLSDNDEVMKDLQSVLGPKAHTCAASMREATETIKEVQSIDDRISELTRGLPLSQIDNLARRCEMFTIDPLVSLEDGSQSLQDSMSSISAAIVGQNTEEAQPACPPGTWLQGPVPAMPVPISPSPPNQTPCSQAEAQPSVVQKMDSSPGILSVDMDVCQTMAAMLLPAPVPLRQAPLPRVQVVAPPPDTVAPTAPPTPPIPPAPADPPSFLEQEQGPLSLGSVGHPHTCQFACKFFKSNRGCKEGKMCPFCHECPWRRALRSSKGKAAEMARKISNGNALADGSDMCFDTNFFDEHCEY